VGHVGQKARVALMRRLAPAAFHSQTGISLSAASKLWCYCNTLKILKQHHIAGPIGCSNATGNSAIRGPLMTISSLTSTQQTKAIHQVSTANDVRTIIANHLGIDVQRVTDEAHFTDDFGADWLDRLELMIEIEDQFPAVEFTDDDVDQIDVVGDLIRHIKRAWIAKRDNAPIIDAPVQ
jgi:acyl carrier protein